MRGELPAGVDHRLDVAFVEVGAFRLEVEDAGPAVLAQLRQREGELGPVAVVEGEDDRLRRQGAAVVPGLLDLFERDRLVAVAVEPVQLVVEVGPGDVQLRVGRVGRGLRRARGTRGSGPGRCAVPSRAAGWRCGPGPSPPPVAARGPSRRRLCLGLSADRAPRRTVADEPPLLTTRRPRPRRRPPPIRRRRGDRRRRRDLPASLLRAAREQLLASRVRPVGPVCLSAGHPRSAIMVGKGPMQSAGQPTEDLAAALRSAYPELEAIGAAGAEPVYLVGGAVRDLLLGRGRADIDLVVVGDAGGAGRAPRRRTPRRARALRHRQGRARRPRDRHRRRPHRDLPAPGRAAGGRAGGRRSRPTSAAATSRSTRWRSRSTRRAAADRPPRRPRRSRGGPAAGAAPATPSSTTRPGRSAPPATRPASASRSSRRPRRCCGRPTSAPSPPTAAGPSCCAWPAKRRAPRGFALLRGVGAGRAARGRASSWSSAVAELLRRRPWAASLAPRDWRVLAAALGPAGRRARAGGGRAARGPREAVELAARPRSGRAGAGPGAGRRVAR